MQYFLLLIMLVFALPLIMFATPVVLYVGPFIVTGLVISIFSDWGHRHSSSVTP